MFVHTDTHVRPIALPGPLKWSAVIIENFSRDGPRAQNSWWLGSLVVRPLANGREFDSRPPRLVLGWVTVFGRAYHLSISPSHPGQFSLLPSSRREMSTGQSAVTLCGWEYIKAGWLIPCVDKRVGGTVAAGKTV